MFKFKMDLFRDTAKKLSHRKMDSSLETSRTAVTFSHLSIGEPAPWFSATTRTDHHGTVALDELAGRYIVLFFFGSAARPDVAEVLAALAIRNDLLDHKRALLLGISNDPDDFNQSRL